MSIINTNILSHKGQAHLWQAKSTVAVALERLSSGLRINHAKDDAAGAAIANRFSSQTRGLQQASRNAQDAISLSQTALGVLDSINERLQRIRELSVQGLSDNLNKQDKDTVQAEINQHLKEIDRLAEKTNFNGLKLLNGGANRISMQVGANDQQTLQLDLTGPGFSTDALGLAGFNIAGPPTTITERNQLTGVAQHIGLYDAATTLSADGVNLPLFYNPSVGYYASDGAEGFVRLNVAATHTTATDTSSVTITPAYDLFNPTLNAGSNDLPALNPNERLLEADGTFYIESRNADDSLSYREANTLLQYEEDWATGYDIDGNPYTYKVYPAQSSYAPSNPEMGSYTAVENDFTIAGIDYNLAAAANVSFVSDSGNSLPSAALVQADSTSEFYIQSGSGSDMRYQRVAAIEQTDRLRLDAVASATTLTGSETFVAVSDSFNFAGNDYALTAVDEVILNYPGAVLVEDTASGDLYLQAADNSYYALSNVSEEYDLALTAASQSFTGVDLASAASVSSWATPAKDFTAFANVEFSGADFSGLSNLTLVQRNDGLGQWVIRGEQADGSSAYFNANVDLEFDGQQQLSAVRADATQTTPLVLGATAQQQDRVSGYSEILIDTRNVSVNYTDLEGQTYTDVLRQSDDGNYFFQLPSSSTDFSGYKTATLVDLDSTGEVVIRTKNGGSEVVFYYPSNVSAGVNYSVTAITDADGFVDDGVAHTQLNIREMGEDFRLRQPPNPLAALDRAIGMVDAKRSYLGAMENRLSAAIDHNAGMVTNLSAAKSRIMDANYAVETSRLAKAQIINQAAQSVLAQANAVPETVLALLNS